jgi:hypothetical protein
MPTPAIRWTSGRAALTGAVLGAALGLSACFDSDDRFKSAPIASTGDSTGIVDPGTSTAIPERPPIVTGGTSTCRDALSCINECIFSVQQQIFQGIPEPDLGCFLECDPFLSVEEAVILIRLFECAYDQCADVYTDPMTGEPFCQRGDEPPPGSSSSSDGGSSSSTGDASSGSDSGSSSSSTGEPPPPPPGPPSPLDPCTTCLLSVVQDETVAACEQLQAECQ